MRSILVAVAIAIAGCGDDAGGIHGKVRLVHGSSAGVRVDEPDLREAVIRGYAVADDRYEDFDGEGDAAGNFWIPDLSASRYLLRYGDYYTFQSGDSIEL